MHLYAPEFIHSSSFTHLRQIIKKRYPVQWGEIMKEEEALLDKFVRNWILLVSLLNVFRQTVKYIS